MTRIWLSTRCLTFDKIPAVFDSFKNTTFQVELESNVKPRYLVEPTCLILISASSILLFSMTD